HQDLYDLVHNDDKAINDFYNNNTKLLDSENSAENKHDSSYQDASDASFKVFSVAGSLRATSSAMVGEGKQFATKWTGPGAKAVKTIFDSTQAYIETLAKDLWDPDNPKAGWVHALWWISDSHLTTIRRHNSEYQAALDKHNDLVVNGIDQEKYSIKTSS